MSDLAQVNKDVEVYTVGFWMPVHSLGQKPSSARLGIWRWDKGKIDPKKWKNINWTTVVTASSPSEAVKKGQKILQKEMEKAA